MTYSTEIQRLHSRKAVLALIDPTQRLQVWTVHSGSIYYKDVDYYVLEVREGTTQLSLAASAAAVTAGEYYFDEAAKRLYVETSGSVDPSNVFLSVKYRLFFSNYPCILPYDLSTGFDVEYEPRIKSTGDITQEIDPQFLFGISLDGKGSIDLINTDGFFDNIYDTLIWENAVIRIYTWFPNTALTEKKINFLGYINSKTFTSDSVKFSAGDFVLQLNNLVNNGDFSLSDGVIGEDLIGKPKPRIYGRVAGKKLISTDKILDGFTGTGTITGTFDTDTITGSGTAFIDELSPGDKIIVSNGIEDFDYDIASISSNTALILSSKLELTLNASTFSISPERPWRKKNRTWLIAGHKLREPVPTVSSIIDTNRYVLSSTDDLFPEDLLEINNTLYRIRRIFGDTIVLYSAVQGTVLVNDVFRKSPINSLYFIGETRSYRLIENRDFTITNNSSKCEITLEDDAEVSFTRARKISASATFTNGSSSVVNADINFLDYFRPRDYIASDDITHTTEYEILSIAEDGTSLVLRTNYGGSNVTTSELIVKQLDLIGDDSVIVADCYGYEDAGVWVRTASDAVKHLVENDAGLTGLNTTSFTNSDSIANYTLSYFIPFNGDSKIKIRDAIDQINQSVFGSLYNNSSFEISYSVLEADKGSDLDRLENDDVFKFSVNTRTDIAKTVNVKYRHFEADSITGETGSNFSTYTSDFVTNLTGLDIVKEYDSYIYDENDAEIINQRLAFINTLSQSLVTIETDLRLSEKSLNDKMWINLDRLYKRFGQQSSQKIGIITKINQGETKSSVSFSDLGNIFNRVASIADNSTSAFSSATDREKMLAGFIVDNTVHLPDTSSDIESNTNLIG